jgi:Flp pilus assembly protein TadG
MYGKFKSRNRKNHGGALRALRAQAMVEFAITLPVLLMLLLGIIEVGRLVFMYAMVTNASRDAVRYASAIGRAENGLTKYNYCEGIKDVAWKSAFLIPDGDLTIDIDYDHGSTASYFDECNVWDSTQVDGGVSVDSGDRVTVTITADYKPIVTLIPIPPRTFTSTSSRTILGIHELDN